MTKRANPRARKEIAAAAKQETAIETQDKANAELAAAELEANEHTELETAKAEQQQTEQQQTEADANELEAMEAERLKLEANQTEQTGKTEQTDTKSEQTESPAAMIERLRKTREELAAKKAEVIKEREAKIAAMKQQKQLQRELEALQAEQEELDKLASGEISLEELEDEDEDASIKGDNSKMNAKSLDALFVKSLKFHGNSVEKIGILREYWKKHSAEFRSVPTEKQQKAIMRRTLNRLRLAKVCDKDGMRIFLLPAAEQKTEESK